MVLPQRSTPSRRMKAPRFGIALLLLLGLVIMVLSPDYQFVFNGTYHMLWVVVDSSIRTHVHISVVIFDVVSQSCLCLVLVAKKWREHTSAKSSKKQKA